MDPLARGFLICSKRLPSELETSAWLLLMKLILLPVKMISQRLWWIDLNLSVAYSVMGPCSECPGLSLNEIRCGIRCPEQHAHSHCGLAPADLGVYWTHWAEFPALASIV